MQTKNQLRPYQIEGVERLISFDHDAILADEPGLGKTIQVAHYINLTKPFTALIVCPASLRLNWRHELDKWLDSALCLDILSYEGATKLSTDFKYDLIVFDEAHYLKNPKAARTKAGLSLPAFRRLFLTGTPIVNKPMDMYPILKAIGLNMSMSGFGKRYCNGHLKRIRHKPYPKYAWDFSGASNTEELHKLLVDNVMVRRRKKDVLTELPAKVRQVIEIDTPHGDDPELKKVLVQKYGSLTAAAEALIDDGGIAFGDLSRYRLEQAKHKLPYVINYLDNLMEETDKVVVFAYHREIIEALQTQYPAAVHLYGGMSDKEKDAAVTSFQQGDAPLFIGQITAAGTGITLTASSTVVFAELDWVPGNVIQAEDRCHRMGQTDNVHIVHLVLKDSIDCRMVQALVRKQQIIEEVIK